MRFTHLALRCFAVCSIAFAGVPAAPLAAERATAIMIAPDVTASPGVINVGETCFATSLASSGQFSSTDSSAVNQAIAVAATGGLVKVAGVCTHTSGVPVHINKALTLAGGYTITNWITPNTAAQRTVISAAAVARGITVTVPGATVMGFTVTLGHSTANGAGLAASDAVSLTDMVFISNTAIGNGGGAAIAGLAVISNSIFAANSAGFIGGGLYSPGGAQVRSTSFLTNAATFGAGFHSDASTMTMTNSLLQGNRAQHCGASNGLGLVDAGSTYLGNEAISGNGGGICLGGSGVLSGTRVIANIAAQSGAGGYVLGALTLTGTQFLTNVAGSNGGALIVFDALRDAGSLLRANRANNQGGGMHVAGAATLAQTVLANNVAQQQQGGGGYFAGSLSMTATQWLSNTANNSEGGGAYAAGPLQDSASLLLGNRARAGGGVYVTGSASLSGTRAIENASSLGSGGGGYFVGLATFTSTQFLDNNSGSAGGGVYAVNAFTDTASLFRNNSAQGNGGLSAQGSAYLRGTRFELNRSTFDGGGAYVAGPLDMKLTAFISNTTQSSSGGGLRAESTLIDEGSRFSENRASSNGGGLRVEGVAHLSATQIVSNSTFSVGGGAYFAAAVTLTATQALSNSAGSGGGGMYASVTLTDTDSLLRNNTTSGNGAGLRVLGSASLRGTRLEGNRASSGSGGGAYVDGPLMLTATRFMSNTAGGGSAGGLYAGSTLVDVGSLFSGNESGSSGGGLLVNGTAHLSATQFVSNSTAFASGGGGYFASAVVLTATQFFSNAANSSSGGGGLYAFDGLRDTGSLLRANRAGSAPGGGIYVSSGTVNMAGSRFEQNISDYQGGGIYVSSGQLVMRDSILRDNRASFGGGGVFAFAPATLDRVQLIANRAQEGAALHLSGSGSSLVNSLLARNVPDPGKGVILVSSAQFTMAHTTIASPTLADAIAIQFFGGSLAMTNTLIAKHATAYNGSVTERYSLFDGVTTIGGPLGVGSISGTAAFVNPALDDYRLTIASAALDAGTPTGVAVDFEGQPRPFGAQPDIGYDEFTLPSVCFARIAAGTVFSSHNAAALRQAAAAAPAGSLVQVAGICAGGIVEGGQRQVLRVDKALNIEGGYTTTNWAASSPANTTVIDAEGNGRVIVALAPLELRAIQIIRGNWAADGAGIYAGAPLTLNGAAVLSNTSTGGQGGGVYATGDVIISNTRLAGNAALFAGGGRVLGEVRISRGAFAGNSATQSVGGLSASGGGDIRDSAFVQNQASFVGALESFQASQPLNVINTLFANNASTQSSIINNSRGAMNLVHATIVNANTAGGLAVSNYSGTLALTNTLIANFMNGIYRDPVMGEVSEDYTLFDRVVNPYSGAPILSGGRSLTGSANFVDEAGGNFRLAAGSAALDRGVDAGVAVDFEGQARPFGPRPDIGYDEAEGLTGRKIVMLPLVRR